MQTPKLSLCLAPDPAAGKTIASWLFVLKFWSASNCPLHMIDKYPELLPQWGVLVRASVWLLLNVWCYWRNRNSTFFATSANFKDICTKENWRQLLILAACRSSGPRCMHFIRRPGCQRRSHSFLSRSAPTPDMLQRTKIWLESHFEVHECRIEERLSFVRV